MIIYTYSQARQNLSELLDTAEKEQVIITRKNKKRYCLTIQKQTSSSPLDVKGVKTKIKTDDILDAIKASRTR